MVHQGAETKGGGVNLNERVIDGRPHISVTIAAERLKTAYPTAKLLAQRGVIQATRAEDGRLWLDETDVKRVAESGVIGDLRHKRERKRLQQLARARTHIKGRDAKTGRYTTDKG